jgi:hypothetical protein
MNELRFEFLILTSYARQCAILQKIEPRSWIQSCKCNQYYQE